MGKLREVIQKIAYWIGFGIGRVVGLFLVKFNKVEKMPFAAIQCPFCDSKRIRTMSNVAEDDLTSDTSGVDYTVYTYSVKCMDCGRNATFKEKWEKEAMPDRIYLNLVESIEDQYCPHCYCKELVEASDSTIVKIPKGFTLYMCKKCGMPVCVTCDDEHIKEVKSDIKEGLKEEFGETEKKHNECHCEHCEHECHHDNEEDDE